jgi:hypothetical protein
MPSQAGQLLRAQAAVAQQLVQLRLWLGVEVAAQHQRMRPLSGGGGGGGRVRAAATTNTRQSQQPLRGECCLQDLEITCQGRGGGRRSAKRLF